MANDTQYFLFRSPVIGDGEVTVSTTDKSGGGYRRDTLMHNVRVEARKPRYASCDTHEAMINNPIGAISGDVMFSTEMWDQWRARCYTGVSLPPSKETMASWVQEAIRKAEDAYRLHVCWSAYKPRGAGDFFRPRTPTELMAAGGSGASLAMREWARIRTIAAGNRPVVAITENESVSAYQGYLRQILEEKLEAV